MVMRSLVHLLFCYTQYVDFIALGITDEVEALGLKGSKKKKGRKLDEDYMVSIRTIESPSTDLLMCLDLPA